ncbi:MAG: LysR family transcriptional regulator [Clostridiales bacterium]|nr:LysR family transcriptional regulator [Clostridiales bacterium]
MNIQQLRYAVEVEKARSITEAAENLHMSQPNLSRALRELEDALGFPIFNRTPRGIVPTAKGEEFLHYAVSILKRFDEMAERYAVRKQSEKTFRLSAPRSAYIAKAFQAFAQQVSHQTVLDYKETNALRAIRNVTEDGYELGMVRYQADYEGHFLDTFQEKGLAHREVWSFRYLLTIRADLPEARLPLLREEDIHGWMKILQGDTYVPSLPRRKLVHDEPNRIHIYDRASALELLSTLPRAYMWEAPMPADMLRRYGLAQVPGADNSQLQKDVLIYRKSHGLSPISELFLDELEKVRSTLEG